MPGRKPESFEDGLLGALEQETEDMLDRLAREQGPPPDADKLSEADEDDAWETDDPSVDYETMAQQLTSQGLPPEVVNGLLVVKLHPEWAPLYQRPTQSAEMAHMLTQLARWPFRLSLIEDIDDPDEQVKKAESLDRRYQKRMTQRQEQSMMPSMLAGDGYARTEPMGGA
jgi:hypothetical protein